MKQALPCIKAQTVATPTGELLQMILRDRPSHVAEGSPSDILVLSHIRELCSHVTILPV